ncbi:MAG: hypothetical protein V3W34_09685 [Phycisphaerae bacterium]
MCGAVNTLRLAPVAWAIWLASMVGGAQARAVDDGSSDAPKPRYLTLDIADAYLEIEADYYYTRVETSSRRAARNRRQTNRQWGFDERLGLNLGGTVLDPSFITYRADLSFALTQDHFDENTDSLDRSDTDRGLLLEYDARLNFFQGKLLSGSLYGARQDDRINRRFQPTLQERRTGFGTSWVFAHEKVPMELSYDFVRTDRRGNRDRSDDEQFIESSLRYGLEWLISDHHKFKLSYEHAETEQEYQGLLETFETTRDLFIIDHELEFGREHQHSYRTRVHWQEESGDFARDFFEIGPQLTLQHGENLQTLYKYHFNRERYAGLDVETQRIDFQAVHQLYSNLTTTIDLFGLYEGIEDDINTTQYGASVDWQYNRKNRFGHLYANLSLAYDTEDAGGDNGRRVILDESATFRDPIAITLRNRNVVPGSVVVTDAGNRRVYRSGLDYTVLLQGNVTRIERVRTGRINDGDTVLIDYQFRTPADGSLDTIRTDFSLEQRFTNGLTPYYRFSYRNQEDDTSVGFARRADRTNHHRVGARYQTKRYTLGLEYEVFDDTVEPYDAFHVNGLLHVIQGPEHTVDTSTRFSRLLFEGGLLDRNVTLIDVELNHRRRLTESLSTIERLAYRYERDSSRGITQGWDVAAGLDFVMGDLSGELTLEYDRLDLPESQEDNFGVYFRVRREFANVPVRR